MAETVSQQSMFHFKLDSDATVDAISLNKISPFYDLNSTISLEKYLQEADDVESWFFLSSPVTPLTLAALYLYFVLALGPRLMKHKPPLQLKSLIFLYNCGMVAFSSWWVVEVVSDTKLFSYCTSTLCQTIEKSEDPELINRYNTMVYYYLISKYVELLDTVFFILRRKQSQVTFLHVYHHTNMAVSTWAILKYVRAFTGSQIILVGLLNSAVHVVMYGYYMLAVMGPAVQKYLWWKRYITSLQMVQFVFIIGYLIAQLSVGCTIPTSFTLFMFANTTSFLILFANFYKKAYKSHAVKSE